MAKQWGSGHHRRASPAHASVIFDHIYVLFGHFRPAPDRLYRQNSTVSGQMDGPGANVTGWIYVHFTYFSAHFRPVRIQFT